MEDPDKARARKLMPLVLVAASATMLIVVLTMLFRG